MPKFQILGRVLPDPLKVTIPSRDIHWIDGNGVEANFKIRIAGSLINIECEPLNAISDNIALLIIRAFDLARASVNLVAFATARLSNAFSFVEAKLTIPLYRCAAVEFPIYA
jgi:hypothetical protein